MQANIRADKREHDCKCQYELHLATNPVNSRIDTHWQNQVINSNHQDKKYRRRAVGGKHDDRETEKYHGDDLVAAETKLTLHKG